MLYLHVVVALDSAETLNCSYVMYLNSEAQSIMSGSKQGSQSIIHVRIKA